MVNREPVFFRTGTWRLLVWLLLVVLFCLLFREEIAGLIIPPLEIILNNLAENPKLASVLNGVNEYIFQIPRKSLEYSIMVLFVNIAAYFFFGMTVFFFVAQFALPIRSKENRWKATLHLLLNFIGFHRTAILIREGKLIGIKEILDSIRPAVILVDLSSAIVIERQLKHSRYGFGDWDVSSIVRKNKSDRSILGILAIMMGFNRKKLPRSRVEGPGLHFTKKGEKITSIIDLRRQSRFGLVEAYTRDGIKISTKVTTLFSLSDKPEIIFVAYLNGNEKENLVGLKLEENKKDETIVINGYYSLNLQDAAEMHSFVEHGIINTESSEFSSSDYQEYVKTPYTFHPERVLAAAYSEALTQSTNTTLWHELPVRVAIDHFRKQLEQFSFDDLHLPNDPDRFPLLDFRDNFNRIVRYDGVLAYKLVRQHNDNHEEPKKWNFNPFETHSVKRPWKKDEIEISPSRNLTNSKILRDRGVRVISASFSELQIVDDVIRLQMVENWKARWDREIEITRARHELEAMRERNRARVQTQREMTYVLSELFKSKAHSKEALALRVFQALEAAATTPEPGKKIAPPEIMSMLNNLHEWLLPDKNSNEKNDDKNSTHSDSTNSNQ